MSKSRFVIKPLFFDGYYSNASGSEFLNSFGKSKDGEILIGRDGELVLNYNGRPISKTGALTRELNVVQGSLRYMPLNLQYDKQTLYTVFNMNLLGNIDTDYFIVDIAMKITDLNNAKSKQHRRTLMQVGSYKDKDGNIIVNDAFNDSIELIYTQTNVESEYCNSSFEDKISFIQHTCYKIKFSYFYFYSDFCYLLFKQPLNNYDDKKFANFYDDDDKNTSFKPISVRLYTNEDFIQEANVNNIDINKFNVEKYILDYKIKKRSSSNTKFPTSDESLATLYYTRDKTDYKMYECNFSLRNRLFFGGTFDIVVCFDVNSKLYDSINAFKHYNDSTGVYAIPSLTLVYDKINYSDEFRASTPSAKPNETRYFAVEDNLKYLNSDKNNEDVYVNSKNIGDYYAIFKNIPISRKDDLILRLSYQVSVINRNAGISDSGSISLTPGKDGTIDDVSMGASSEAKNEVSEITDITSTNISSENLAAFNKYLNGNSINIHYINIARHSAIRDSYL